MTKEEFKKARNDLGLSQEKLAVILRIGSDRTIRKWESGERKIPGPVIFLMEMLLSKIPRRPINTR